MDLYYYNLSFHKPDEAYTRIKQLQTELSYLSLEEQAVLIGLRLKELEEEGFTILSLPENHLPREDSVATELETDYIPSKMEMYEERAKSSEKKDRYTQARRRRGARKNVYVRLNGRLYKLEKA